MLLRFLQPPTKNGDKGEVVLLRALKKEFKHLVSVVFQDFLLAVNRFVVQ